MSKHMLSSCHEAYWTLAEQTRGGKGSLCFPEAKSSLPVHLPSRVLWRRIYRALCQQMQTARNGNKEPTRCQAHCSAHLMLMPVIASTYYCRPFHRRGNWVTVLLSLKVKLFAQDYTDKRLTLVPHVKGSGINLDRKKNHVIPSSNTILGFCGFLSEAPPAFSWCLVQRHFGSSIQARDKHWIWKCSCPEVSKSGCLSPPPEELLKITDSQALEP